jgi:hypothetical protein
MPQIQRACIPLSISALNDCVIMTVDSVMDFENCVGENNSCYDGGQVQAQQHQGWQQRGRRAQVRQRWMRQARFAALQQVQDCELLLCSVPEGALEAR